MNLYHNRHRICHPLYMKGKLPSSYLNFLYRCQCLPNTILVLCRVYSDLCLGILNMSVGRKMSYWSCYCRCCMSPYRYSFL